MMKSLFLLLSIMFLSCSLRNAEEDNKLIIQKNQLRSFCKGKSKTVVFIWTSWCGAANGILRDTYSTLSDSMSHADLNMNVLLLCGTTGYDALVKQYDRGEHFRSFYIPDPGNGIGMLDRRSIRKFITSHFTVNDKHQLKDLHTFGFSVPITLVVDEQLNVIDDHAPQDLNNLIKYCSYEP